MRNVRFGPHGGGFDLAVAHLFRSHDLSIVGYKEMAACFGTSFDPAVCPPPPPPLSIVHANAPSVLCSRRGLFQDPPHPTQAKSTISIIEHNQTHEIAP